MPPRVHQELVVNLRRVVTQHERSVDETDSLEAQWVGPAEGQELEVNLAKLNVEFPKVTNVIQKYPLTEVTLNQLVL